MTGSPDRVVPSVPVIGALLHTFRLDQLADRQPGTAL